VNLGDARQALGDRGFDYLTGASMNLMLNRARNDFEDYWEWPWLRATATGPAPLELSDLKYVKRVSDPDGVGLWGLETNLVDTANPDGDGRHWYLLDAADGSEQVTICLLGGPLDITVDYIRQTPELTADDQEPVIPKRYHPLWIDWAVIRAYQDSDNHVAAQALQGDLTAAMLRVIERYETRNRMHSRLLPVISFSEDE